jgi:hypothetical protein
MDDCDAMEMIDKLNEEHDATFQLNADLHRLNQKLKRSDKKHRSEKAAHYITLDQRIWIHEYDIESLKERHDFNIEYLKNIHSNQMMIKDEEINKLKSYILMSIRK